jgi:hypothetical protein
MLNLNEVAARFFNFGVDVLVTSINAVNGVLSAQLGNAVAGTVDSDLAEWWQHVGFASRPAVPTQGQPACQAAIIKQNDHDVVFATRDVRGTAIYGNLADGETCVYAGASQARALFKADGSARLMTTDTNATTGALIYAGVSSQAIDPSTNQPAPGGEFRVFGPWGGEWMDPTGYHLRTWQGVNIDAGGMTVSISGLSVGGSSYSIGANLVNINGQFVTIGGGNVGAIPGSLVVAPTFGPSLAATLTTLTTALQAVLAFTGTGTFPGLEVAIQAANGSIAALAATLTSGTTNVTKALSAS